MAIKKSRGLTLQPTAGAPVGNKNAHRHGLYSRNPAVKVAVGADATMADMEDYVGVIADGALWIGQELNALAAYADEFEAIGDLVDVYEQEQLVALYAAVAGEAYDLRASLQGRAGLRSSPLARLSDAQYDQLLRGSAASLELLLSKLASAKQRLEIDGVLVADRQVDNQRKFNPTLTYMAGMMRKAMRQLWRHAEYVAWVQDERDGADQDPAAVLSSARVFEEDGQNE